MRALRYSAPGLALVDLETPEPGPGEVRLRVAAAGICRTDLYAADGVIAVAGPVVIGHEVAGWIDALGPGVERELGALAAVDPALGCGECGGCGAGERCFAPRLLGLDVDGAFAGSLVVPAAALHLMPASMPPRRAAYLEPVAAALAVAEVGLEPAWRGAVVGSGRIAELTCRALASCGHREPLRVERAGELGACGVDYVVETGAAPSLDPLVAAIRPGGVVVLKSRPPSPASIDLRAAVQKRVTLQALAHGSFAAAADLLASGGIEVDDLFGDSFALADWAEAFAAARAGEGRKLFFEPSGNEH